MGSAADEDREARGGGIAPLGRRELDVLALIADGASNNEIAQQLYLSPHTVKWYASEIYRKLGVTGRAAAASKAERLGLLP